MSSECELLIDLWDHFRDLIGAKVRGDAALHLIRLFEEHGFEIDLKQLEGEDNYLDEAIEALREDDEDDGYDEDDY